MNIDPMARKELHRQTGIQKRCADSYMIVGTSIGSMVEHNYIIILILKADEDLVSDYVIYFLVHANSFV